MNEKAAQAMIKIAFFTDIDVFQRINQVNQSPGIDLQSKAPQHPSKKKEIVKKMTVLVHIPCAGSVNP